MGGGGRVHELRVGVCVGDTEEVRSGQYRPGCIEWELKKMSLEREWV